MPPAMQQQVMLRCQSFVQHADMEVELLWLACYFKSQVQDEWLPGGCQRGPGCACRPRSGASDAAAAPQDPHLMEVPPAACPVLPADCRLNLNVHITYAPMSCYRNSNRQGMSVERHVTKRQTDLYGSSCPQDQHRYSILGFNISATTQGCLPRRHTA